VHQAAPRRETECRRFRPDDNSFYSGIDRVVNASKDYLQTGSGDAIPNSSHSPVFPIEIAKDRGWRSAPGLILGTRRRRFLFSIPRTKPLLGYMTPLRRRMIEEMTLRL
jgi:hypothetical protein